MNFNRRGFFGRIGAALAGCVLANTPLAGKLFETQEDWTPSYRLKHLFDSNPITRQFIEFPVGRVDEFLRGFGKEIAQRQCEALYG